MTSTYTRLTTMCHNRNLTVVTEGGEFKGGEDSASEKNSNSNINLSQEVNLSQDTNFDT